MNTGIPHNLLYIYSPASKCPFNCIYYSTDQVCLVDHGVILTLNHCKVWSTLIVKYHNWECTCLLDNTTINHPQCILQSTFLSLSVFGWLTSEPKWGMVHRHMLTWSVLTLCCSGLYCFPVSTVVPEGFLVSVPLFPSCLYSHAPFWGVRRPSGQLICYSFWCPWLIYDFIIDSW